ncbi:adenine nucleotide alpha hydrolases-like protein [Xylaria sp. CBS 124048]|nr:adenine nucleotide alpha hydrolases-like protein [Xylaria sp. CBS 124048]
MLMAACLLDPGCGLLLHVVSSLLSGEFVGAVEPLSVIALISGGKDSFFSILHCQANGHHVVALANLYPSTITGDNSPPSPPSPSSLQLAHGNEVPVSRQPGSSPPTEEGNVQDETDLNSFMYQTVGHQVIPLYAQVTGLPVYRQPILGTAIHQGLSYARPGPTPEVPAVPLNASTVGHLDAGLSSPGHGPQLAGEDETESLIPLLRAVLRAHPEANALCTGAILSTYQRTRIESVALRLGLVPLSYLWQFTELPASVPGSCHDPVAGWAEKKPAKLSYDARRRPRQRGQGPTRDDARLLRDMAAVGLDARIVKVASAGFDEDFLWENVASDVGLRRVERAMRRFGAAAGRGSILGEGGEFETLVIDGPTSLFKGRIVVSDENRRVIHEGGGCAWLHFPSAHIEQKNKLEGTDETSPVVRAPGLLDPRFEEVMQYMAMVEVEDKQKLSASVNAFSRDDMIRSATSLDSASSDLSSLTLTPLPMCQLPPSPNSSTQEWCYFGGGDAESPSSITEQTDSIVGQIRRQLDKYALPATAITNSVIVLRHMSDFPLVNERYGSLFDEPNPPSRVTISCGDKLPPKDAMIAVYLTVQSRLQSQERRGLHVQSRSYWAPANIGPYSQAIAFPLLPPPIAESATGDDAGDDAECDAEDDAKNGSHTSVDSPLAVSIAGQIPLVPASMTLPPSSTLDEIKLQIILALQHLWRIGIEMEVRWWTSAVAYFPVTSSVEIMQQHVLLAAAAWKLAHLWPDLRNPHEAKTDDDNDDDDDNDNDDGDTDNDRMGPDLWDRRYNSQYMTYGGSDEEESFPLSLPSWNVLKGFDVDDDNTTSLFENKCVRVPFFFAAEVHELPRQAGVEWHAQLGLAKLPSGSVTLLPAVCSKLSELEGGLIDLDLHHVIVESEDAVFVQTISVVQSPDGTCLSTEVFRKVCSATTDSLGKLAGLTWPSHIRPKITYVEGLELRDGNSFEEIGAIIPCRSLWDSHGRRLRAISVFETRLAKVK